MQKILEVKNLTACIHTKKGDLTPIDYISFHVNEKEMVGLVGESGCGKSITVLSVMKLIDHEIGTITADKILLNGEDISNYTEKEMCSIRGKKMSMIFQEPMTSLNPVMRIGKQISETLIIHDVCGKKEAKAKSIELLSKVGILDPERVANSYPHNLSGGMRQRVMIAMAIICKPKMLFADEPTTALDVTIQAQILNILKSLQESEEMGVVLVTHDLGIVAEFCDRVIIMYCGQIIEEAETKVIFKNAKHPYTKGLLRCIPKANSKEEYLDYIEGSVMPVSEFQQSCRFAERCPEAMEKCFNEVPPKIQIDEGHTCCCWLYV